MIGGQSNHDAMRRDLHYDAPPSAQHRKWWQREKPAKVSLATTGKFVRFRWGQMLLWSTVAGACFAAVVAGAYYLVLETNWGAFYLKGWWDHQAFDNLISRATWPRYRHAAYRDQLEPAAAVMGVMTLLAKPKWWAVRVGAARLAVTPLVLLALAIVLSMSGVWLLDFGLQHVWHAAPSPARIWETLVVGVLIGRVLHRVWAPVGATIQGQLIDGPVIRSRRRGRFPLWVRYPLAPPVLRERFSRMWRKEEKLKDSDESAVQEQGLLGRLAIGAIVLIAFLLMVTGFIAHFWIGTGHSFPFLAPEA